jgi:hypothetical protein
LPDDLRFFVAQLQLFGAVGLYYDYQQGRFIASLVMTLGPALTNNVLDPPGRAVPASAQQQAAMLERLDAILAELRRQSASS